MKRLITETGIQSLKLILSNPRFLVVGTQRYLFEKGYLGKIPIRPISALYEEIISAIAIEHFDTDLEGLTITELAVLSWIARNTAPDMVFEFGTADGRTTLNFALNTYERCKIYTLDLPEDKRRVYHDREVEIFGKDNFPVPFKSRVGCCFLGHSFSDKITQLYGDSTQFDYIPYHGQVDLIFIDANHDYPYVRSDSENALKMLSKRGTIVWHDYPYWEGVRRYLDGLRADGLPLYRIQDTRLVCYSRHFVQN
jgi:hypothetical protein